MFQLILISGVLSILPSQLLKRRMIFGQLLWAQLGHHKLGHLLLVSFWKAWVHPSRAKVMLCLQVIYMEQEPNTFTLSVWLPNVSGFQTEALSQECLPMQITDLLDFRQLPNQKQVVWLHSRSLPEWVWNGWEMEWTLLIWLLCTVSMGNQKNGTSLPMTSIIILVPHPLQIFHLWHSAKNSRQSLNMSRM